MNKDWMREIEDRLAYIEHCLKTTDNFTPFKHESLCNTCRRKVNDVRLPKKCDGCQYYIMNSADLDNFK